MNLYVPQAKGSVGEGRWGQSAHPTSLASLVPNGVFTVHTKNLLLLLLLEIDSTKIDTVLALCDGKYVCKCIVDLDLSNAT